MLIPVTAADVPDFLTACTHEHVFGSRIRTAMRAHGLGDPTVHFYLCRKGREAAAALSLADGVLTVSADERADAAPIAELIQRMDVHEVDASHSLCQTLQGYLGGKIESSYFMVYRGTPQPIDCPDIVPGDKRAVFDVLQRSHEYYRTHLTYDTWAADLDLRLSRGLAELYQLISDGQVIGTGSIVSWNAECGVIGAVAVVPEYRHRGLGARITRFLVQRIREAGKTPRLVSGYDEVAELYRQIGFAPCGRWGELYL